MWSLIISITCSLAIYALVNYKTKKWPQDLPLRLYTAKYLSSRDFIMQALSVIMVSLAVNLLTSCFGELSPVAEKSFPTQQSNIVYQEVYATSNLAPETAQMKGIVDRSQIQNVTLALGTNPLTPFSVEEISAAERTIVFLQHEKMVTGSRLESIRLKETDIKKDAAGDSIHIRDVFIPLMVFFGSERKFILSRNGILWLVSYELLAFYWLFRASFKLNFHRNGHQESNRSMVISDLSKCDDYLSEIHACYHAGRSAVVFTCLLTALGVIRV